MAAGQLIGTAIQQVPDNMGRLQAVPGASGVRFDAIRHPRGTAGTTRAGAPQIWAMNVARKVRRLRSSSYATIRK